MFDSVIRVGVLDKENIPIVGATVTWTITRAGQSIELGPATTQGFVDKPVEIQIKGDLDSPYVDIVAKFMDVEQRERVKIETRNLTMTLPITVSGAKLENNSEEPPQFRAAALYGLLSLISILLCFWAGWYLLNSKVVSSSSETAAQGFFVVLAVLGLTAALVLFGILRSTARLTGQHFGYAIDLGGPVVVAVLVVFGGFHFSKPPDDFLIVVRMRTENGTITDATRTSITVDFGVQRLDRTFSPQGEALFPAVPSRFKRVAVPIAITGVYRLKKPEPTYQIPDDGVIYLDVTKSEGAPTPLESCSEVTKSELRISGWTVFGQRNYDAAERVADRLLVCDKKDFYPYNLKGSISFYRAKYDDAVGLFEEAVKLSPPDMPDVKNNLADSLVELALQSKSPDKGGQFKKALEIYSSVNPKNSSNEYKIARVLFLLGEHQIALGHITSVPTDYEHDGGRGKARILEGAIYISMANDSNPTKKQYLERAKSSFLLGVEVDRSFWINVFRNQATNPAESFGPILTSYGNYASRWLSEN